MNYKNKNKKSKNKEMEREKRKDIGDYKYLFFLTMMTELWFYLRFVSRYSR